MKEDLLRFETGDHENGARLDMVIAARFPAISRSLAQKLIKNGAALVNGRQRPAGFRLAAGMQVELTPPPPSDHAGPAPEHGGPELEILFEDEFLMVINKRAGLVVHPGAGHGSGTLVNQLLASGRTFSNFGGPDRPGIVHRLDKDTSGVMIVARDNHTHELLGDMFRERTINKTYLAVVLGPGIDDQGLIETSFGRRTGDRRQFTGRVRDGRDAVTGYRTLLRANLCALVAAKPMTGRTHQIRVHLSEAGHPIVGDRVYGRGWPRRGSRPESEVAALEMIKRHALHAWNIRFAHPVTGQQMDITAPLPGDFRRMLDGLFGDQWKDLLSREAAR